jgi:hypothetical protein
MGLKARNEAMSDISRLLKMKRGPAMSSGQKTTTNMPNTISD